jgi:hypothetical protein
MATKGTLINGCAASEHLDSSGERISIKGMDISSLERGEGVLNYEHKNEHAAHIVGKVVKAKKIFTADDCDSQHELYFWNRAQVPFLYIVGELFDAAGHQQAKEIAAIIKYDTQKREENPEAKNVISFSVEGAKLEKQGSEITRSIARKISLTGAPCNKAAVAEELVTAPVAPVKAKPNPLEIFKSETSGAFRTEEMVGVSVLNVAIEAPKGLQKSFPGALTQTAALTPEDLMSAKKKKAKEVFKSWPHADQLIKFIRSKNPALTKSEAEALAKVYALRMTEKAEKAIVDMEKAWGGDADATCKPTHEGKKVEPLKKPYVSDAQRKWAHTEKGKKALGGEAKVKHWDKESKGKVLPERVAKSESSGPKYGETAPHLSHEEFSKLGPTKHSEWAKQHSTHSRAAGEKMHRARRAGDKESYRAAADLWSKHGTAHNMHQMYADAHRGRDEKYRSLAGEKAKRYHKELSEESKA